MNFLFSLFFSCLFLVSALQAEDLSRYNSFPVGELGKEWDFTSDHLPVGLNVDGFHLVFWNVLNKNYLGHIEENGQGLRDSSILKENIPVKEGEPLTIREKRVLEDLLSLVNDKTRPRSILALEEVHSDLQKALEKALPSGWKAATPEGQPLSQDIFFYDSHLFDLVSMKSEKYDPAAPKSILILTLKHLPTGHLYRLVQSHVPGGPSSPAGVARFAKTAIEAWSPDMTIILMGDMNAAPEIIQKGLIEAAKNKEIPQTYRYLPTYPTHMNTKKEGSWIDLFFYSTPKGQEIPQAASAQEMFPSLLPVVKTLESRQKS